MYLKRQAFLVSFLLWYSVPFVVPPLLAFGMCNHSCHFVGCHHYDRASRIVGRGIWLWGCAGYFGLFVRKHRLDGFGYVCCCPFVYCMPWLVARVH